MKRTRLRVTQHDLVLNMFEAGHAQTRIADALNVPIGAVAKVVKTKYPDFKSRVYLPVKEIVSKYKSGETMDSLAMEYNTTGSTIKRRLIDAGVEIRPHNSNRRKHFFDDSFFEVIDSPVKAYWLGFIFADGMVMSTRRDVVISLSTKDRSHLDLFSQDLSYDGPGMVKDYVGTGYGIEVKYSRASLRSPVMWGDLVSRGCLPNKSLDLGAPSDVPPEFVNDFIRGVVDGDGYISSHGLASIEIVGAYDLLKWISDELGMNQPRPHKTIWRIRVSGRRAAEIVSRLYGSQSRSLQRKQERANKIIEEYNDK